MAGKTLGLAMLLILTALTLSGIAYSASIGVAPAYTGLQYEPGSEKTVEVRIYDSNGSGLNATLSISGELAQYFSLSQQRVEIVPGEKVKGVNVTAMLPAGIRPGTYTTNVIIVSESTGKGTVGAVASVSMQIYTAVLSDKYLSAFINISADKSATITVSNIGLTRIDSSNISLEINGGQIVKFSAARDLGGFAPGEQKTVREKLSNLNGDYSAKIVLDYDKQERIVEKGITIGVKTITPEKIEIPSFKPGEINRLVMTLTSNWNIPTDVEPKVQVYSSNTLIAELAANNISIINSTKIDFFWDTKGLPYRQYTIRAIALYEGESKEKDFYFSLSENQASIEESGARSRRRMISSAIIISAILLAVFSARFIKKKFMKARLESLINGAVRYAEYRDVKKAAEAYTRIRQIYDTLSEREKKKFYDKLMKVYNFIRNQKNKKIEF